MTKPSNGEHRALEPTVIDPEQVAVVYDPERGYQILLPRGDDDAEVPEPAVALIAAGARLSNDRAFYDDMLRWWEEHDGGDEGNGG